MFNKTILVGRLGHNPTLKKTSNDKSVCSMNIVTNDGYGEHKTSSWHNVVIFGARAESCAKYLSKGSVVVVEGTIRYDEYESKGEKKKKTTIYADNIVFVSTKRESQESGHPEPVTTQNDDNPFLEDAGIPF